MLLTSFLKIQDQHTARQTLMKIWDFSINEFTFDALSLSLISSICLQRKCPYFKMKQCKRTTNE